MIDQEYQKFEATIDKILANLGLQNGIQETKKNIIASLYFNYLDAIFTTQKDLPIIQKLKNEDPLNIESFYKLVEEGKSITDNPSIDFNSMFKNSCNSTLSNFVAELESKLPPEKIAELNKIISEEV